MLDEGEINQSAFVCQEVREQIDNYEPTMEGMMDALYNNVYALNVIPVDTRFINHETIMDRLYAEVKMYINPQYKT
jgi:hypothetical protein